MLDRRYRVTIWWPGIGEVKKYVYVQSISAAIRIKEAHAEATICVWAGNKDGWQVCISRDGLTKEDT